MKTIGKILLLVFTISSCLNNNKNIEQSSGGPIKKPHEIKVDSTYSVLTNDYKAKSNWEDFNYKHLYQLQDFLVESPTVLVIRYFDDFELFRKDSTFICSYRIDEFVNDVHLNLKINKDLLSRLQDSKQGDYNFFHLAVIRIDSVRPIDFEFRSELDDYRSKVIVDRYMSLLGYGELLDYKTIVEKKENPKD